MAVSGSSPFRVVLRRHRIAAGFSQEELAGKAGLSTRAISDLERGVKIRPRPYTARQLADALQLHSSDRVTFLETACGSAPEPLPEEAAVSLPSNGEQAAQHLPTGAFLGSMPAGALVARNEEYARLLSSVGAVLGGEGRLVLLAGDPGVGKTRLAQEVTAAVHHRGFLLAAGRCYEPQQTAPFYPFLDLLATLHGLAPPAIQGETSRRWPYMARLLPDQLGLGALPPSDHPEDQQRLFSAVTGFVRVMAENRPLALMLDDVHWADSASIDLLAHLTRHTRDRSVLLMGTYRDTEARSQSALQAALHDLGREGLLDVIPVRRLGEDGTAGLMAALMGGVEIPPALARLVHHRTDGNAFFVQQVVHDLMESGVVSEKEADWTRRVMDLPESIRAAIGYRLRHLGEQTRAILHAASVLGQTFSFEDLHAMTGRTEDALEAALDEARLGGLVRELDTDVYSFDHVLTQQALYEELSGRHRRKLHLAAGAALETLPERQQERRAVELAWHFRRGSNVERGLVWTMRAGEQAEAVFAYQDAEQHYRMVLDLAQRVADRAREAEGWEKLGRVLKALARYDEALAALEKSADMYGGQGDVDREAGVIARIGLIYALRGASHKGLARIQTILETLPPSRPSPSLAGLYAALVRLYDAAGRHELELTAAQRAVEAASMIQDRRVLAGANVALGDAYCMLLRFDEALEVLREAAYLAEQIGDPRILYGAYRFTIFSHLGRGQFVAAREAGDRAVDVAERLGDPEMISLARTSRTLASLYTGDWDWAEADIDGALSLGKQSGTWTATIFALILRGRLRFYRGDWEEASQSLEESAEMAEKSGNLFMLRWAQVALAERDVLIGRPDNACRRLLPQVEAAREAQDLSTQDILPTLIWAYLDLGDLARAKEMLDSHVGWLEHLAHSPALARHLWLHAMLATRCARWEEAQSALDQGLALTRSMKYSHLEGRLLTIDGQMHLEKGELGLAREGLAAAESIFRRLGARSDMERIERILSASGLHGLQ